MILMLPTHPIQIFNPMCWHASHSEIHCLIQEHMLAALHQTVHSPDCLDSFYLTSVPSIFTDMVVRYYSWDWCFSQSKNKSKQVTCPVLYFIIFFFRCLSHKESPLLAIWTTVAEVCLTSYQNCFFTSIRIDSWTEKWKHLSFHTYCKEKKYEWVSFTNVLQIFIHFISRSY